MSMDVLIKTIKDPSSFVGVKVNASADLSFVALLKEVNDYYNDSQMFKAILSNPKEGMRCIVSIPPLWHRAKVDTVLVSTNGFQVRCSLVDEMSTVVVSANRVFVTPEWVWEVPAQVIHFALHGVRPMRLVTDYVKDEVLFGSEDTMYWSASAIKWFKNYVAKSQGKVEVKVMEINEENIHFVKLFMVDNITGSQICLNEILVKNKFAVNTIDSLVKNVQGETQTRNTMKTKCVTQNGHLNKAIIHSEEVKNQNVLKERTPTLSNKGQVNKPTVNHINELPMLNSINGVNHIPKSENSTLIGQRLDIPEDLNYEEKVDLSTIPHPQAPQSCVNSSPVATPSSSTSPNSVVSIGRGKSLLRLSLSPKQQLNLSPPQVQRCMNGVEPLLSHIKTPEPLTINVKSNLSKLTEDLTGDVRFTERLVRVIQATNTVSKNKLPGGMSLSELRLLKLEKFLEEEKAELRGEPKLVAKLRPVTLCEEESEVITQSPPTQEKGPPVKPQKINLKNKPKELFVKKLLKNQREKNNTMLVHGVEPPNPIPLFCRAPFPESMVTKLESSLRYRGPRSIQSYAWPAILDKRSLVALSPTSGGKTLAYVAPIVTMLQRRSVAPKSCKFNPIQATFITQRSPSVVVLCSTWRKVQSVTDMFDMFMSDRDKEGQQPHRVIGITGGPEVENERSVDLILGCSVLVCSPYTLIRICRNKSVDLTRLEQLVIDDIHTLVEAFTEQVGTIMRMWMEVLRDPDRPNIQGFKPQVLGFGIQWTTGVKSFMKTFMNNQSLLYISHPLEASVFGKVQHHTIITSNTSSYNSLLSLIQHYEDVRAGGVAVYVKDISTLTSLAQALTASSIHCITAHACMEDAEIQQIHELFTDASNSPVLVLTDDVIPYLDIDSIQITIHYNFPPNKHDFGLRLSLMSSFYHSTVDKDKKNAECCSYMFFSEDNAARSVGFVKFLNRIKQPIPVILKKLAVQSIEVHESSKQDLLLCPFFQAYGACRDINVCGYRHVISSLDKPNVGTKYSQVPTSGHVRVKVTCIVNATRYYARLMKHRDTISGVVRNIEGSFQEISKDLIQHFSTPRAPCLEIKRGKLICVKLDNMFYRVVPLQQESCDDVKWQTVIGVYKARVRLVDVGTQAVVNVENLFELPQHLVDIPYQAIEVRACCVKPLDNDIEWLMQANELVHNLIFEKEIEGNIVLALGHTIWLKPVVIRSKLPKTGVVVTDCDIIEELVSSGLAVKNTDHVKCLLEASSNKIIEITENASNTASLKTENETNFEELEVFENENLKKNLDGRKENASKPEEIKYASPSPSHAELEDKSVSRDVVSQLRAQVPDSAVKCGGSPHKEIEMGKKEKKADSEKFKKVDKMEVRSALEQNKSPIKQNRDMGNTLRVAYQEMPCFVNGINSHMKKVENVTVTPVNVEGHESDREKRLHGSKTVKETLQNPPKTSLEDCSGIVYPLCVEYLDQSCAKKRNQLGEHIYIICSELPEEITERDLVYLMRCLGATKSREEKMHICGSLLSLAHSFVPIEEFIDIKFLTTIVCDESLNGKNELQIIVLTLLSLLLVEHKKLPEKQQENLTQVACLLVKYLDLVTTSTETTGSSKLTLKLVHVINMVCSISNVATVEVKNMGLIEILIRIKSTDTTEVRKKLFMKLFTCEYDNTDDDIHATPQEPELPDLVTTNQKQAYDCLNYDRFNSIDTDSVTTCRPYTPVYAKFDTDNESTDSETDTVEVLPGC